MTIKAPSNFCRVHQPIEPDAYAAATVTSDGIDCKGFRRALVIVNVGTMGASADLDIHIEASSTSITTGYADITGAVFATLEQGTDDDTVVVGEVNLDNVGRWIRVVAVTATAAVDHGVTIVLIDPETGVGDMTRATVANEAPAAVSYAFRV